MKKKFCSVATILTASLLTASMLLCAGCNKTPEPTGVKRVVDGRDITAQEYTAANTVAVDKTGRVAPAGDVYNGNDVGLFYHTWHGVHETAGQVLDLTEILADNPDYLTYDYLTVNAEAFHYWGQPLYGYYCSADPWVITRHIELFINMGIDYLAYDCTNASWYETQTTAIFEALQKFYDQGFDVPKVTFYTNSSSAKVICQLYERYYSKDAYKDLWYAPNGKPLIIGRSDDGSAYKTLFAELRQDFFDFRETQWPDHKTTIENTETGFPWMSWEYPQKNFNGMMPVSLAQHADAKMSFGELTNYGRGYDFKRWRNVTANKELGTNYESQWQTVLENNANEKKQRVTQVLVTGFNEWMAQKLNDGDISYFVDTFSEEYSRDIEMMKGGYDDNYVIQTLTNTRRYRYSEAKHYKYQTNTILFENGVSTGWDKVRTVYRDLVGDAMPRSYRDAFSTTIYADDSNRNDIASVAVTHDSRNLYVKVETQADITAYNGTDKNWMNLLISTSDGIENTFGGFEYIVNRTPDGNGITTVERSTGGYNWQSAGTANYVVYGNAIVYSIPLNLLGLSETDCYVRIKASDNVTHYDDIMDYYVSGDCAPIGRFAYAYGY